MKISLIVAFDNNFGIGFNNQLLCHLPNDLKFFKANTWGLPIVMGRNTFDSLNQKSLPGRWNMVLSNTLESSGEITIINSFKQAVDLVKKEDYKQIMIIGGASVYKQALPFTHEIFATHIHHSFDKIDTYFPDFTGDKNWKLQKSIANYKDEKHLFDYSFNTYNNESPLSLI